MIDFKQFKKFNKKAIIIPAIVVAIAIVITLIAVLSVRLYDAYLSTPKHQKVLIKDANENVNQMFDAITTGDESKIDDYVDVSQFVPEDAKVYNIDFEKVFLDYAKDVTFEAKSTTFIDSHNVVVKGTVTAPDLASAWGSASRNNIKNNLFNLNDLSEEEQNKLLEKNLSGEFEAVLDDGINDNRIVDVTIHYVRSGLTWKLQPDEELCNALLGDLYTAINTTEINRRESPNL